MKKALLSVSVVASSITLALAQQVSVVLNGGTAAQQGQVNTTALQQLIVQASNILAMLVPLAVTVAVLAFFWYLIRFIMNPSAENKNQSLKGMGFSILALFVMVSIWGLVGLLGSIVGVNQGGNIPIPGVPRLGN